MTSDSIEARIKGSARASAVERAFYQLKRLEQERSSVKDLQWVEPMMDQLRGITRRIDLAAAYPLDGVDRLPLEVTVGCPAHIMIPGEDIHCVWTMPLIAREQIFRGDLDSAVRNLITGNGQYKMRSTIDAVSFLPFPREGAPEAEQFKPEFHIKITAPKTQFPENNHLYAVVKYGEKVIPQIVNGGDENNMILCFEDPYHHTHFSADMLMNMTAAEVANTRLDAGSIDIYLGRVIRLPEINLNQFYYKSMRGLGSQSSGSSWKMDAGLGDERGIQRGSFNLSSLSRAGETRGLLDQVGVEPANPVTQVGAVKVGAGTTQEKVQTGRFKAAYDSTFPIQHLRITFLGVREGSYDRAKQYLATNDFTRN